MVRAIDSSLRLCRSSTSWTSRSGERSGQQPQMPRLIPFEDDDAAGIRADVDDGHRQRMMSRAD